MTHQRVPATPSHGPREVLHVSPDAGYEDPFAMLDACHERMERMLDLLARLRVHLHAQGCDDEARQAARDVLRYFDVAAPAHHADEERHVFPVLLAAARCVGEVQRLQRDHVEFEAAWSRVRPALQRAAAGTWHGLTMHEEAALESFASIYARHVPLEESVVFPAARELMDASRLAAMGREMAQRRGVAAREQGRARAEAQERARPVPDADAPDA
jgi:hemerythrin-like domain-containing protein